MGAEQISGLVELALDKYTLLIAGGIFILLRMIKATPLAKTGIYWRVLPVLPEALGCLAAVTGCMPAVADQPLAIKIAAGLWCGYLSQRFHKVLGQTVLGDDPDITRAKSAKIKKRKGGCEYCGGPLGADGQCPSCGARGYKQEVA
jgi:hypothetical protein